MPERSGQIDSLEGASREALERVLQTRPVDLAVVFGSRVEGTPLPWSDLDIAVRFEERIPRADRFRHLDEIRAALENVNEGPTVDVSELDALGPHRAYQALHSGILVVGDDDDRVKAEARALVKKLDFDWVRERWQEGLRDRLEGGTYGRA